MITVSKEDYLKAILEAESEGEPVISATLAHWLSVSPPAVTMAMRRLKKDGLVRVQGDGHVSLTTTGRKIARKLTLRHHLIERMLSEVFGMEWFKVHDEAERLEHAVSPDFESKLLIKLGRGGTCPHGNVSELESPASRRGRGLVLLAHADEGKSYLVSGIYERDRRLLEFLEQRGIRPGSNVHVSGRNYDQTLNLKTEAGEIALGRSAAERVWVAVSVRKRRSSSSKVVNGTVTQSNRMKTASQELTTMPELTYLEAIRQGIWEEMERDPTVFCIGEDIGIYGGAFKVTDGFIDRFGAERVIDTPIAESAIVGAAFGASLTGMRPVAEFQFMDFIGCAFNQITNMVAKTHYLWGPPAPMVLRGPSGGNVHGGPFHSQNNEMYFVHTPGLKVVCPATAYDAKGLIKASIRDNNPVIFFEHKYLYRRIKGQVPSDDYVVPIGQAQIAREGRDLSIITYAAMVHVAAEAAEILSKEGIEVEILDLRTLSPLDREAIIATVRKTNKVILLHEDVRTGGIAGELAAIINEDAFDELDGPIVRITALDTPVPFSPPQEEYFLPKVSDVVRESRKLKAY